MGFMEDAKKKLGDVVDKHGDQIGEGLDKAAKLADEKTKHKYTDSIGSGVSRAKEALDGLDGKNDDIREKKA